jgi:hypothetical protein
MEIVEDLPFVLSLSKHEDQLSDTLYGIFQQILRDRGPLLAARAVVVPQRRPQKAGGTPAPQDCHDTCAADQAIVLHLL